MVERWQAGKTENDTPQVSMVYGVKKKGATAGQSPSSPFGWKQFAVWVRH